jgi:hypothetical protein
MGPKVSRPACLSPIPPLGFDLILREWHICRSWRPDATQVHFFPDPPGINGRLRRCPGSDNFKLKNAGNTWTVPSMYTT